MPNWKLPQVQQAFVDFVIDAKNQYSVSQERLADLSNVHKDTAGNTLNGKTSSNTTRIRLFKGIAALHNKERRLPSEEKKTWMDMQEDLETTLSVNNQTNNQEASCEFNNTVDEFQQPNQKKPI